MAILSTVKKVWRGPSPLSYGLIHIFRVFIGIEKFWWSAKNYFNKRVMAQDKELDVEKFHSLVLDSVNNSLPIDKVHRLCASNRKYVAQILQSQVSSNQ